ncbi:UNVERIFIED_CONTAM: hypothetical protein FKN15_028474 [Acipenser sinensis]
MASLWICSAKNDGLAGTCFGGHVFQHLFPESPGGCMRSKTTLKYLSMEKKEEDEEDSKEAAELQRWIQEDVEPAHSIYTKPHKKDMKFEEELRLDVESGGEEQYGYIVTDKDTLDTDTGLHLMEVLAHHLKLQMKDFVDIDTLDTDTGLHLMEVLAHHLKLQMKDFVDIEVLGPAVTFIVRSNPQNLTTADVANAAAGSCLKVRTLAKRNPSKELHPNPRQCLLLGSTDSRLLPPVSAPWIDRQPAAAPSVCSLDRQTAGCCPQCLLPGSTNSRLLLSVSAPWIDRQPAAVLSVCSLDRQTAGYCPSVCSLDRQTAGCCPQCLLPGSTESRLLPPVSAPWIDKQPAAAPSVCSLDRQKAGCCPQCLLPGSTDSRLLLPVSAPWIDRQPAAASSVCSLDRQPAAAPSPAATLS